MRLVNVEVSVCILKIIFPLTFVQMFLAKWTHLSHFVLDNPTAKDVIIEVLYRPPDTNVNDFNNHLDNILINLKGEHKHCYLVGDFNINLLHSNIHSLQIILLIRY